MPRTAEFLRNEMERVNRFWNTAGVPINYGEWGTEGDAQKDPTTVRSPGLIEVFRANIG